MIFDRLGNFEYIFISFFSLMIPCFFVLPTIFGGMTLFFSCCCYFAVSFSNIITLQ